MFNPFCIRTQKANLEKYAAELAKLKAVSNPEPVFGTKTAIENARQAYSRYTLSTYSRFGKIASFIPGTAAFESRIIAARAIDTAFGKLKQVERNIKALDKLPPNAPLKRSRSADTIDQPKYYPSPLQSKKTAVKGTAEAPRVFQRTIFRVN